ncbi:hypothetical protein [Xanthobacter autotrophicus]|uniref:hypothetical protein n=1 Tax=Xanthobacter autotrophicus TaxID=280 RepID=UPI00372CE56E
MSASEIIIVRSLTESDMGLFSAHRKATTSKQRAIALTTVAAEQLLHPSVVKAKGAEFDCICLFGGVTNRESRIINKGGKNWRMGGRQLAGEVFAGLDSKDFALIRSVRHNDSTSPILLTFVGRRSHRFIQAGLAVTFENQLHQSVAIFQDDSAEFETLAELFPSVPAKIAVQRSLQQAAFL